MTRRAGDNWPRDRMATHASAPMSRAFRARRESRRKCVAMRGQTKSAAIVDGSASTSSWSERHVAVAMTGHSSVPAA